MSWKVALDIGQSFAAAMYVVLAIQLLRFPGLSLRRAVLFAVLVIQAGVIMGLSVYGDWMHAGRATFLMTLVFLILLNWNVYVFYRGNYDD